MIGSEAASPNAGFTCRSTPAGSCSDDRVGRAAVAVGLLFRDDDRDIERARRARTSQRIRSTSVVGVVGVELLQEPRLRVDDDEHAVGVVDQASPSQVNARSPVIASPITSVWTSSVPSYVITDSRFVMWRMIGYSSVIPFAPWIPRAVRAISSAPACC